MTINTIDNSQHKAAKDINSIKKQARFAGFLYLLAGLPAPFALLYVPGKLIVWGNAAATADNVRAFGSLLRLGIAGELLNATIVIFAIIAFYHLFKVVNEKHALTMMILFLVSIPILFLNVLNEIAAQILASGADYLSVFEKSQLDTLVYLSLYLHNQGIVIAQIFWGLWLFPFGMLVIRSGFIPRILGVFLIIAGSAYVIHSLVFLFLPQYTNIISQFAPILEAGEIPIMFWLLIWGAKAQKNV